VVVAIGGNALSSSGEGASIGTQFRHTRESLAPIVEFARAGWNIAVVHGNGPQVGDELFRNEIAHESVSEFPLGVLVASTAGWIGYMIQQSLQNALAAAGVQRRVVTMITQVRVDPERPSATEPRKFIGRTCTPHAAAQLRERGVRVEPDARGRLRRRVPSPEPLEIIESDMVSDLVKGGDIVIAAGGGGIPVYADSRLGLEGLDGVIDKDRAAAILARDIGARVLLILTDVDGVYERYGQPGARRLGELPAHRARQLLIDEEFGTGSMRPKVEAALSFVDGGGECAVIAALAEGRAALDGRAGTRIIPDAD